MVHNLQESWSIYEPWATKILWIFEREKEVEMTNKYANQFYQSTTKNENILKICDFDKQVHGWKELTLHQWPCWRLPKPTVDTLPGI